MIWLFLLSASPAWATFTVCNQTLDLVNVAVGQSIGDAPVDEADWTFQTEGWWTIGANQCVNVVREELANRYVYVYATDVFWQPILSGTTQMCIASRRFVIRGLEGCWLRGYQAVKFIEVDTQEQARWTLFLTTAGP